MRMKLSYVSILFIVAFATSGIKSQSVTDNLIDDANLNEYEKEEIDETLSERQSNDIGDPKEYRCKGFGVHGKTAWTYCGG